MLVILDKVLGEVNSLSEYLQSSSIILSKAIDVSKATVKSLEAMRSDACFSDLWTEAETAARIASVSLPIQTESPKRKRKKTPSSRLEDCILLSSTGVRDDEFSETYNCCRSQIYEITDNLVSEISLRLLENDDP